MFCCKGQKVWPKVLSLLWTSSDPYPITFSCNHICACELKTALYVLILCLNPLKEVITKYFSTTKLTHISEPKKVFKQIKGPCIPPSITIVSEYSLSFTCSFLTWLTTHNSQCQDMPLSPMNFLLKIGTCQIGTIYVQSLSFHPCIEEAYYKVQPQCIFSAYKPKHADEGFIQGQHSYLWKK